MNSSAKFIVWDWNGTLFDDFDAMLTCNNIIFERFGHAPSTPDTYRQHYEIPFSALLRNQGFKDDEVAALDELSKEIFHDQYEPHAASINLREGAEELLRDASKYGIQSLILSNHLVEPIRAQLKRLKIDHLFAEVLAYANRGVQFRDMTKGEKLRHYMKNQPVRAGNTLIVGDSTEEIEIARTQGLISVAITGGCVSEARLRAEKPDYVIHSMRDLKPILQERGFVS